MIANWLGFFHFKTEELESDYSFMLLKNSDELSFLDFLHSSEKFK